MSNTKPNSAKPFFPEGADFMDFSFDYHNPFLTDDCQDEGYSSSSEFSEEHFEAVVDAVAFEVISGFTDGCAVCYALSNFKTRFTPKDPDNRICPSCLKH